MGRDSKRESAMRVMETIPLIMRSIGSEMRKRHSPEMSAMQFRALSFISYNEGASLTNFAEFTGISLSSASKIIDGLAGRRLVKREAAKDDRRRIVLSLTPAGGKRLEKMQNEVVEYFAEILAPLAADECSKISKAMELLGAAFDLARQDLRQGVKK